ncbi:MAG TPA: AMP-binding protein [Acidimicrobiales bacterium]|nr:AMP-binding protein [Acidimicrobiales bacterium]
MEHLRIGDVVSVTTGRAPRRVAASLAGRRLTYSEIDAATAQLVRALAHRNIGAGHRVVWWGDTSLDAIALWFALARLGAVCVPMNPHFTPEEAARLLDQADPALVVGDDTHAGQVTLGGLLAAPATTGISLPRIDEEAVHVIFFTSGSSGRPKGVELSHRASRLRILGDASMWPSGPVVCMFPQFHMAGWYGPMTVWASADEVVYVERAEADALLGAVHERRAIRLYAIPAVWRRILEVDRSSYDLSCLRYCDTGTSSTTPELLSAIADAFPGTQTSITYGSTEAGGVCRLWPQDVHRKPGSVGPPALGSEVRLAEDGELLVRNPVLMNGYFRDPEATAAALVDGWFHTGDLAERDDEGYYSIVGRAREVIRTGGETVAPVEVDDVLLTVPGVVDAGVAGVPDDNWGELITAFVVLQPGRSLELPEMRRHCEGRLAPYKHPRRLVVVEALPRTGATGQIQRRTLVEWAQASSER